MGNLNCTRSRGSSSPALPVEQSINNNSTGVTRNGSTVSSREVVASFLIPSADASSNTDIASNFQTLASRNPTPVSVNATNAIQQENTQNLALYSKLASQLPDNPEFYSENFIDNASCDPKQYLKDNGEKLIKAFSDAISTDSDLRVSAISIKENREGNHVLTFEGYSIEHCQNTIYDPIKQEEVVGLSERLHEVDQEFDLSDVIEQSKNLAEFITNMRLAATFVNLSAKINAPAIGFNVGLISPFTGLWQETMYSHREESLEKFFTPDMKYFSFSEMLSIVQEELFKEINKGEDIPGSLGGYSSSIENPIKMHYV
jgi:hypothetical protein